MACSVLVLVNDSILQRGTTRYSVTKVVAASDGCIVESHFERLLIKDLIPNEIVSEDRFGLVYAIISISIILRKGHWI